MQKTILTKEDRLQERNNRIRKRFNFLTSKKHYATNYTLEVLADEYLPLTEETIWLIVSKTGFYKSK
jgi:hypothetical protein